MDVDKKVGKVTCLAQSTKTRGNEILRCTNPIAKDSVEQARKDLKGLRLLDASVAFDQTVPQLVVLARLLVCKKSHSDKAFMLVQNWVATSAFGRTVLPYDSTHDSAQSGHFDTSRVCIRRLVPYVTKTIIGIDTETRVSNAIKRDLTARETYTAGQIYVYWFPGNFGHIKMGLTTQPV